MAILTSKRLDDVTVALDSDGSGCVNGYDTTFTSCTCYDMITKGGSYYIANDRRMCKHIFALHRVTPCQNPNGCSGLMLLNVQPVGLDVFECACGWTIDARLVVESRQTVAVQQAA